MQRGVKRHDHGEAESLENVCSVCLSETEEQTPCGHLLCAECRYELRKNDCPVCRSELPLEGAGPRCREQEWEAEEDVEDLPMMVRQNAVTYRPELRDEEAFRERVSAFLQPQSSCEAPQTRRSGTLSSLGSVVRRTVRGFSIVK